MALRFCVWWIDKSNTVIGKNLKALSCQIFEKLCFYAVVDPFQKIKVFGTAKNKF
jgi:hypothetical protein